MDDGYFAKLPVVTQRRVEALPHIRLGDICCVFRKGIFDIKASTYVETGVPFIRIGNLRSGLIDTTDLAYITSSAHSAAKSTALEFGDIVLSKTAYAAASFVNVPECNVSQDMIAARISKANKKDFKSGFVVAFLNSRFGLALMGRHFQGNVQSHLSLPDGKKVPVPRFTDRLQSATHERFLEAHALFLDVQNQMDRATTTVDGAVGLQDWKPDEPLAYSARAADAFGADRFDAEYFHPAKRSYLARLRALPGRPLGKHYRAVREMFDPTTSRNAFVRNFDLNDALNPVLDDTKAPVAAADVGSTKKQFSNGDVVTSRLRAYLRETALVRTTNSIPAVGSSEFIVLRPRKEVEPTLSQGTLLVFLRSRAVQTILYWSQDGSQHPRYGDEDLLSIPVPDAVCAVSDEIDVRIEAILAARARADSLLKMAIHAVEIAIDQSEDTALRYLREQ